MSLGFAVVGVFFIGAMPWVQLFDDDGDRTGWASAIRVDWSSCGSGRLMTLKRDGRVTFFGDNRELAAWLWEWYLSHSLPTVDDTIRSYTFEPAEVELDIDPARGLRAGADGLEIVIDTPLNRHLVRRAPYPLGEFEPTCSWVRICCEHGAITVDGRPVPGRPATGTDRFGVNTTAQLNVAEVWTT